MFAPNGYGVYDVCGNVWEWIADWYSADYYGLGEERDPRGAPTGTGAPEGRRDNCLQFYACHFLTPVDETSCIDHLLVVKNFQSSAPRS